MASPSTEQAVERSLARLPGVSAKASYTQQTVRVEFNRGACAIPEIVRRLDALGLRLRGDGTTAITRPPPPRFAAFTAHRLTYWFAEYRQLSMAIVGGVLLLAGFLVHAT